MTRITYFAIEVSDSMSFGLGCSFNFVKVIGNVFDNPELLGAKE
jgi:hypothetical protein